MRRLSALLVVVLLPLAVDAQDIQVREILRAALEATGGETAWNKVHSLYSRGRGSAATPMGDLAMTAETWFLEGGYMLVRTSVDKAPAGVGDMGQTMYFSPDEAWMETGISPGRINMDTLPGNVKQVLAMQRRLSSGFSQELMLLQADSSMTVALGPDATVGDRPVYTVVVNYAGLKATNSYDKESHFLLSTQMDLGPGMPSNTIHYSDYREVDGIKRPFTTRTTTMGTTATVTIDSLVVNPDLSVELLKKIADGK